MMIAFTGSPVIGLLDLADRPVLLLGCMCSGIQQVSIDCAVRRGHFLLPDYSMAVGPRLATLG
jgi:hypothetical protein